MIEIQWGAPVALRQPHGGDTDWFSTIEKARYWLRRKWPVSDTARRSAIAKVEAAMTGERAVSRCAFMISTFLELSK